MNSLQKTALRIYDFRQRAKVWGINTLFKTDFTSYGDFNFTKGLVQRFGVGRPETYLHRQQSPGVVVPAVRRYLELRFLVYSVSILRSCILKIKQEIFRNGADWQPNFAEKCVECDTEFDEPIDPNEDDIKICPECKRENTLKEPDLDERNDFEEVIKSANLNRQKLLDVLQEFEEDLEVGDDAYIIIPKEAMVHITNGEAVFMPLEIFRGDPDIFRLVVDKYGIPGGKYWKCVECGKILEESDREKAQALRCPNDASPVFEVFHVATPHASRQPTEYYIEGEVLHVSKYSPSILYGFSPVLTVWNEAWTVFFMDQTIRKRFEFGRMEGLLAVPTRDIESLYKAKDKMETELKKNPNYMAWIPYDPVAKTGIKPEFIPLLGTLTDNQYLEAKKELRERISSIFGVSLVFQSDSSTGGGRTNEGLQMKVTDRAVEYGQSIINDIVMPWIMKQYGITDSTWMLNPSEEQDAAAEAELFSSKIGNATGMLQLGYVPTLREDGDFEYERDPDKAREILGGGGEISPPLFGEECGMGEHQHDNLSCHSIEQEHRAETTFDLPTKSLDSIENKSLAKFIDPRKDRVLKAIEDGALFDVFEEMTKNQITKVRSIILDSMTQPQGWSIDSIVDNLERELPKKFKGRFRVIARTESTSIQNVARKLDYKQRDPEDKFKFKWIGPAFEPGRSTLVCKAIKEEIERRGGSVKLKTLEKIINEKSKQFGHTPRPFLPHIQCRHTLRRDIKLRGA